LISLWWKSFDHYCKLILILYPCLLKVGPIKPMGGLHSTNTTLNSTTSFVLGCVCNQSVWFPGLVSLCKDSSACWHTTGMSSHASDHTCDSAPSKHILCWCCDLIFVHRTQLGKEEGQKVEGWEDKLAVSEYFEYILVAFCQKLAEKQTNHGSFHCAQFWSTSSGCDQGVLLAQLFLPLGRRSSI
jgi:hypothetical protein